MRASAVLLLAAIVGPGCRGGGEGKTAAPDRTAAALALVEQGRHDEAIAQLGEPGDPESLYVLGRAWAGKASSAPLPTPEPGLSAPPDGLYKAEELTALRFLEQAVAARPDHARAHLALAELLAPHALARQAAGPRAQAVPASAPPPTDASVERVLRSYGDAIQADPAGVAAAEAMVRFATAAGRLLEADGAFQELVRRRREDPDLLVRYGDFLAATRGAPEAALAQYAQALIWRPADAATREKVAAIHVAAAAAHVAQREYASAEARLKQARRFGADQAPALAARLRELDSALEDVRGR